ncbi:hypothetical protein SAMN03159489_02216 [Pseudomonas sp. NFPP07]|uniref:hypothetical protein n=1 Tax=Pseudomonas sp. NFPP07 TaxID=1566213 RepID=UPI0008E89FE3|nr:hypothetical protein [Pseudomonas sp. NFPP07]SFP93057.1 hypothetical protein SAMN03159489_02216 [Pseudomonas sp. NFPP07]
MTEKKHTPGPWIARKTGGQGWVGQRGWAIDFNEDQEQVVDFVYEEADAKLIAAAPDLLAELQETHAALCFKAGYIGTERYKRNAAAIAKATQ